jgi:hypothetical protein
MPQSLACQAGKGIGEVRRIKGGMVGETPARLPCSELTLGFQAHGGLALQGSAAAVPKLARSRSAVCWA